MKATKIIMGIAAAAVVALTGCKGVGAGLGDAAISYSPKVNAEINAEATATVNHKNESADQYARGLLQFANKKKGVTANLVIKDLDSNAANPGLIGFAFDMKKNSDGTWNFCTIGVQNKNGVARAYVYYYKNVAEADLSKADFGRPKSDQTQIKEFTVIPGVTRRADNTLQVVVEIEALKASDTDADGEEETYSVDVTNAFAIRFYETPANGDLAGFKGLSNKATAAKNAIHETAINKDSVWYVTREQIDYSKSAAPLEKMAFYANVYGGQTLNAEWQIADMKNNPNVMKSAEGEKTYGDFDIVFVE